jgi:hypothetical protein
MTDIQQHQEYNKILIKMAKEQLMEDIDSIVEAFFLEMWEGKYRETQEDLTRLLCDAVCLNFPAN